jgi:predicted RNase H-like nuclease (RuvC/YqgF family)
MKLISFGINKIQNVGANLLDHLKDLQEVYFYKNSCIDKSVYISSQVPGLIEELRQKCPDIEPVTTSQAPTTTSEPPTTTMKTFPVECEHKIEKLIENKFRDQEQKLSSLIEKLTETFENFQNKMEISSKTEILNQISEIEKKLDQQKSEISTLASKLLSMESKTLESEKKCETLKNDLKAFIETENLKNFLGGKIEEFCKKEETSAN